VTLGYQLLASSDPTQRERVLGREPELGRYSADSAKRSTV